MKHIPLFLAALGMVVSGSAWAETKSVRVKTANFREDPSADADILFTADRHYPVEILDRKRGWAKVRDFEGEVAWVAERLLSREPAVVVTVERANLRERPQRTAAVVLQGKWSDAFPVEEMRGPWIQVRLDDDELGWIHRSIVWGWQDIDPPE